MRNRVLTSAALLAALTAAAGQAAAGAPTLEFIGEGIVVTDISENGSVIVGNVNFDGSYETWRWAAGDPAGWQRLGAATVPVLGTGAGTPDVSYDGTKVSATIVGETLTYMTQGVWTKGVGWQETMPPLPPDAANIDNSYGSAWGLSGDGSTLTGFYWSPRATASYWTQPGGVVGLPKDPMRQSRANCADYDGSVIAGWEEKPGGEWRPTAWRNGVKITLADSDVLDMGEAVTADGSTIVGSSWNFQIAHSEAARWDWNGSTYVFTNLGSLPGTPQSSIANVSASSVTDDGSMVVGRNAFQNNGPFSVQTGFVWTAQDGMRDIVDFFADHGVVFPPDYQVCCLDVSPDGSAIAGTALNLAEEFFLDYRSFVFRFSPLPACADINGDNAIDTADLGLLVGDFGDSGPEEPADFNGDGVVDTADLGLLIEAFGESCY